MNRKDEILNALDQVPALPAVAQQVVSLLADPDVDAKAIAKAIEYDPGMTANVLNMANSSYYNSGNRVNSVQLAVARLGNKQIAGMVLGSSVAPIAMKEVDGYDLPPGALWEHSVAVAVACNELACSCRTGSSAGAFTAGLLHDIGKVVLGHFVHVDADAIRKIAFDDNVSFVHAERQTLGIDHAEVGALLLKRWNIPDEIVEAVRWHHEPHLSSDLHRMTANLVHAAEQVVTLSGIGAGEDGSQYPTSPEAAAALNIRPALVEQVLNETAKALAKVSSLFQPTLARRSS